jgi:hypothetical protein
VHKWLKGPRIALLISIILHATLFIFMRGTSLYSTLYSIPKALGIDLINVPPDTSILPPMLNRKIDVTERILTPIKRTTITKADVSKRDISPDELPRRQISVTMEAKPSLTVPSAIPDISQKGILSNPPSITSGSESSKNTFSQGKELGRGTGGSSLPSRKNIADSGKIIKTPERKFKPVDNAVREKLQIYNKVEMPYVKAFQELGKNIVGKNQKKIDVAFIIDISESMEDDIEYIRIHLNWMIESFREANLDFTLGLVTFHYNTILSWLGTEIEITDQTHDVEEIRNVLRGIKVGSEERALDAFMKAFSKVNFRKDAGRHFIFITDEYVKGTYAISDVLKEAKRSKVVVDVIGRDEPFQRSIAEQTNGIWLPIESIENQ